VIVRVLRMFNIEFFVHTKCKLY